MADITLKQDRNQVPKSVTNGIIIFVTIGILLVALGGAYIWFSGGNGRASMPLVAPQLSVQSGDTRILFQIVPDESEVRFQIDETLLGEPKTVIGTTNQVAGDLLIDFETPTNSQIGLIRINVRTLTTDNEFRNRALRGQILQSDQAEFEFAEFVVTDLINLPDEIQIGETMDFQIAGNLNVHGVTQPVIFNASITPISSSRLEGIATTSVDYHDFDITIPEAPGVANVSDELQLVIDFVAIIADE